MRVAPATQEEVLRQFVNRLIAKLPNLSEQNCYHTDNPLPDILPEGDLVVTVSAGDGSFPEPFTTGGGHETLTEQASVMITVLRRSHLDQPTHVKAAMFDKQNGLVAKHKPALLSALLIERMEDQEGKLIKMPWLPRDKQGTPILRDQPFPTNCTAPRPVTLGPDQVSWIGFTLTMSILFDWRLDG